MTAVSSSVVSSSWEGVRKVEEGEYTAYRPMMNGKASSSPRTRKGTSWRFACLRYNAVKKKCRGFHMPVCLDMVSDHVRHRFTAALVFMGLLSFIVFTIFNPVFVDPTREALFGLQVATVTVQEVPSAVATFDVPLFNQPAVLVTGQDGKPLPGVSVTVSAAPDPAVFFKLTTSQAFSVQDCIRPRLLGNTTITTNSEGLAYFSNIAFQGQYCSDSILPQQPQFVLSFSSNGVTSLERPSVQLQTTVGTVRIVNFPTFSEAAVGAVLPQQPVVQVLDNDGQPMAGQYVTATVGLMLAWFEAQDFFKLGTLSGQYAGPSNETGYVEFTDLTITSTTSSQVYLIISSQHSGNVWGDPARLENINSIPISSSVANVQILQQPASSVLEGERLSQQPSVKVTDSAGSPLAGKTVFAMLSTVEGIQLYKYYCSGILESIALPKGLVNFTAITDQDGIATFQDLAFEQSRPAGVFAMTFVCDGVSSPQSDSVVVDTSVNNLVILQDVNPTATFDRFTNASLGVVNLAIKSGASGVLLKRVEYSLVSESGGIAHLRTRLPDAFSLGEGLYSFEPLLAVGQPGTYHLVYSVDGVNATSGSFEVFNSGVDSQCSFLEVTSPLPSKISILDYLPNFSVRVMDSLARPLSGEQDFAVISLQYFGLRTGLFPTGQVAPSDSNGLMSFSGVQLLEAPPATIFLIIAKNPTCSIDISNPPPLLVSNPIHSILTSSTPVCSSSGSPLTVQPKVCLKDVSGNPLSGFLPSIGISKALWNGFDYTPFFPAQWADYVYGEVTSVIHGQVFLFGPNSQLLPVFRDYDVTNDVVYEASSPTGSDGCATFNIGLQRGYNMPITLVPLVAGLFGPAFDTFSCDNPLTSITIQSQPGPTAKVLQTLAVQPSVEAADALNQAAVSNYPVFAVVPFTSFVRPPLVEYLILGQDVSSSSGVVQFSDLVFPAGSTQDIQFQFMFPFAPTPVWSSFTNTIALSNDVKAVSLSWETPAFVSSGVPLPAPYQPVVTLATSDGFDCAGVSVNAFFASRPPSSSSSMLGDSVVSSSNCSVVFTSLSISGTPGEYKLQFLALGVQSQPSSSFNIVVVPRELSIVRQPLADGLSIVVGSPLPSTSWPCVRATLNNGMAVANARVIMSLKKNSQLATLDASNVIMQTNQDGIACFDLVFSQASGSRGENFTLQFMANAQTVESQEFPVVSGVGSVTIVQQPAAKISTGKTFSPAPQVKVTDKSGNPLPLVTVYASTASPTSMVLSGSTASTNSDGIATFSNLAIAGGPSSEAEFVFNCLGLDSDASNSFSYDNPAQPDTESFSDWDIYIYIVLGVSVPLFLGTSMWAHQYFVFASFSIILWSTVSFSMSVHEWLDLDTKVYSRRDPYFGALLWFELVLAVTLLACFVWQIALYFMSLLQKSRPMLRKFVRRAKFPHFKISEYRSLVRMLLKGPDPREVLEKIEQERLEEEILRNEGRCARFWRGFKTACREICLGPQNKMTEIRKKGFFFPLRLWICFFSGMLFVFLLFVGGMVSLAWLDKFINSTSVQSFLHTRDQVEDTIRSYQQYLTERAQALLDQGTVDSITEFLEQNSLGASLSQVTVIQPSVWSSLESFISASSSSSLTSWVNPLKTSVYVGCSLATLAVLGNFLHMFILYRGRIMMLRRGAELPDIRHAGPVPQVMYISLQTWATGVCFAVLTLGIAGGTFLFLFEPIRNFLFSKAAIILGILLSVETGLRVGYYILGYCVLTKHGRIFHRRWFLFFDLAWSFFTFLPGILYTVLRFALSAGFSMGLFMRMDIKTPAANLHLDHGFNGYSSMMMVDHVENNPIRVVFLDLLIREMKRRRRESKVIDPNEVQAFCGTKVVQVPIEDEDEKKEKKENKHKSRKGKGDVRDERSKGGEGEKLDLLEDCSLEEREERRARKARCVARNRWFLAVTLLRNPDLCHLRAHYLRWQRQQNEMLLFGYTAPEGMFVPDEIINHPHLRPEAEEQYKQFLQVREKKDSEAYLRQVSLRQNSLRLQSMGSSPPPPASVSSTSSSSSSAHSAAPPPSLGPAPFEPHERL